MSWNEEELAQRREQYGDGPWVAEPDRIEWRYKGVPCLMTRGPLHNWCGYAAVPPAHPWHGKGYGELPVEAHGGLTYADSCQGHVCHVPQPGEPDDVWWLGFDCAHAFDYMPGKVAVRKDWIPEGALGRFGESYKDEEYVRTNVEQLAEQILASAVRG